jgi:ADP-ribose pyrophosphatase
LRGRSVLRPYDPESFICIHKRLSSDWIPMPHITKRETLIDTPWVKVLAKTTDTDLHDYIVVQPPDYASMICFTQAGEVILVEQYRPAVEDTVLEMPAGTIEPGEDPADCAVRELLEETGYRAGRVEVLGWLYPDVGRLTNRIWGFVLHDAVLDPTYTPEAEITTKLMSISDFNALVADGTFKQALHVAFWGMWLAKQRQG